MQEIWRDIVGYEGLYSVSNLGRIKSLKYKRSSRSKVLKGCYSKGKYITLRLCNNGDMRGYSLHRLIAITFINNPLNKRTVNHINGIKTDNRVENLEWATDSENILHSSRVLSNNHGPKGLTGKKSPLSKGLIQYSLSGTEIKSWDSLHCVERSLGISISCLSQACNGIRKQAGGFKWKYL